MANRIVRIESITIENFKNVTQGTLDFENKRKDYKASVLGLYGQNGSGKTALIDAIQLLKFALCGKVIPKKYADYINVDAENATLKYEFVVRYAEIIYKVWYQFSMRKVQLLMKPPMRMYPHKWKCSMRFCLSPMSLILIRCAKRHWLIHVQKTCLHPKQRCWNWLVMIKRNIWTC